MGNQENMIILKTKWIWKTITIANPKKLELHQEKSQPHQTKARIKIVMKKQKKFYKIHLLTMNRN